AQTNCADPTVLKSETPGDAYWYVYCTSDSLADDDVDGAGQRRLHKLPGARSLDLVHWESIGDAFAVNPSWVAPGAGLWAPEIVRRNGLYYLYYVATDVVDAVSGEPGCGSDNAIGVATSASLAGPWVDSGAPVVAPRRAGGGCNFFWTYDPDVLVTGAGSYLYYGSYYGGLEVRALAADGLLAPAASATPIAIANRYEGANVVARDGYYYLFASASNCCNGPLTGYQVFVARATSPTGPFVDELGLSLLEGQVGGTPVLTMNGNRWVGVGHNSVFQDAAGDWFTAYHAIDEGDPYFAGQVGYSKRPMLLDRVTWSSSGWPEVRARLGASDVRQLAPQAQPFPGIAPARPYEYLPLNVVDATSILRAVDAYDPTSQPPIAASSDEFSGPQLGAQWTWVRPPSSGARLTGAAFQLDSQPADLNLGQNSASVLTAAAPSGNYVVEAKVTLDVPPNGCCFNFVQAGLVAYGNDDRYVKLVSASIWETRQTEFAKEVDDAAPGYPAYGTSVGAAPGPTTWLRVAKVRVSGDDYYVSYTSRDGAT
ncbi:MAG: arabinan endo-1,5-alpha-L-arabinosidase, partial [Myxococcales bacterium]